MAPRPPAPNRLLQALDGRTRIARRGLIRSVTDDLARGACSVLERAYLRDVERAHGLPEGDRQVRASCRGVVYRDVEYAAYGVVVELDGRADHTGFDDRDRDLDRDLDATLDGRVTARLGWGQVLGRSCLTVDRIVRLLRRHGWAGRARRCPSARDDVLLLGSIVQAHGPTGRWWFGAGAGRHVPAEGAVRGGCEWSAAQATSTTMRDPTSPAT